MPADVPRPYVIGLGANLGSRLASLRCALELLEELPGCRLQELSSVYDSEPLGPPQPRFLNAAVRVETTLGPEALLDRLLCVETDLGRRRRERWGPRVLDLDILWAAVPFHSERLVIPHPALRERWFALQPLLEVAPELWDAFGEDLVRCGGSRSPAATLGPVFSHRGDSDASRIRVQVRGRDGAELLATALSALCAHIRGARPPGRLQARSITLSTTPGVELAALAEHVLSLAGDGFLPRQATVTALDAGRVTACFPGMPGPAVSFELVESWQKSGDNGSAGLEVVSKAR